MKIYLDFLLLREIIINYAIVFIVEKITNIRTREKRRLLSATVASVLGIIAFFLNIGDKNIIKIVLSAIILNINFKFENIYEYMQATIILYSSTFLIAGLVQYAGNERPITIILIVAICLIIKVGTKRIRDKYILDEYKCKLEIPGINGKIHTLIDTGNEMESKYAESVIILSKYIDYSKIESTLLRKIKFKTVSSEKNEKEGKLVRKIKIISNERIYIGNAVVIQSEYDLGEYDALIGTNFLKSFKIQKQKEESYGSIIFDKEKNRKDIK